VAQEPDEQDSIDRFGGAEPDPLAALAAPGPPPRGKHNGIRPGQAIRCRSIRFWREARRWLGRSGPAFGRKDAVGDAEGDRFGGAQRGVVEAAEERQRPRRPGGQAAAGRPRAGG
jgi:hypothetical protein